MSVRRTAHAGSLPFSLAGAGGAIAAAFPIDTEPSAEPSRIETAAPPTATGVIERTSQAGTRWRRTGCSISTNERTLTISVTAMRRSSSGAPFNPVES